MIEHDGCDGCKYFAKYSSIPATTSDMPCFDCENAHKRKTLVDKYEPMTNADKIRNMSDEELKNLLYAYEYNQCDFCNKGTLYQCDKKCSKYIMEWLQSEAKGCDNEG